MSPVLAFTRPEAPIASPLFDGPRLTFERDEILFAEGARADYVYRLVSGVVRRGRVLRDGRRQIDAFHLPGDYLGLELGEAYRLTAEALTPVVAVRIRRSALEDMSSQRNEAARALLDLTIAELGRCQDHVLLLGRRAATERVAVLLLDFAQRSGVQTLVDVPVSRQDMADYLCLTIETVSRCISQLQQDGLIALPAPRKILLRDRAALERMVG
jgi:CRP/FNR family nitrogen fixation transcriptional regulator